jgi:hypothetical protein
MAGEACLSRGQVLGSVELHEGACACCTVYVVMAVEVEKIVTKLCIDWLIHTEIVSLFMLQCHSYDSVAGQCTAPLDARRASQSWQSLPVWVCNMLLQ